MPNYTHALIDKTQGACVNLVIWDGIAEWNPGDNFVPIINDGTLNVGDLVDLVNGEYVRSPRNPIIPDPVIPDPTPEQLQSQLDAQALRSILDKEISETPELSAQQDSINTSKGNLGGGIKV